MIEDPMTLVELILYNRRVKLLVNSIATVDGSYNVALVACNCHHTNYAQRITCFCWSNTVFAVLLSLLTANDLNDYVHMISSIEPNHAGNPVTCFLLQWAEKESIK